VSGQGHKAILITGGSRGIGRATAIQCGMKGWSVAVNYIHDQATAEATVADVMSAGGHAFSVPGDVTSEAAVLDMFDQAQDRFGRLDGVLVNAAIVARSMTLAEMNVERLKRMFDVNILGAYLCAREAARRLGQEPSGGSIVLVSSTAARLGSPFEYVDYAGSKGAIDTLTIGLSKELGPQGVRVNAVRPGVIDTRIHASGGQPDRAKRLGSGTPLGRAGQPDEVAALIVWLLGDEASYTTGAIIDVAGGR